MAATVQGGQERASDSWSWRWEPGAQCLGTKPHFSERETNAFKHGANSPGLDVFYLKDETGSPVAKQFVDPAVIHEPSSAQPKGIHDPKATKVWGGGSLQKIKTEVQRVTIL